jgi:uncharacterized protein YcaQ
MRVSRGLQRRLRATLDSPAMPPTLSASDGRTLLLQAQGLLDDPNRPAGPKSLSRLIDRLGFVQLDSINVVDRGHHLTLGARLHRYQPSHLANLLEKQRSLFEHWTHDASAIPSQWYPHWKPRFRGFQRSTRYQRWLVKRLGPEPEKVIRHVKRRLRAEGPLMSRDFEIPKGSSRGTWWGWTPHKTALESLWHTGTVAVAGRENFHKIYDLSERVHPELRGLRAPGKRQHVEWACATAIERLGVATSGEIAGFWKAIPPAEANAWCRETERRGRIVAVEIEDEGDRRPRAAFAVPDWEQRLSRASAPPAGLRVLSPFDPVIRDRRRLLRRFGFDYTFEAFVPAAKRRFGYYVLPILSGDTFVGRLDPKMHRDQDRLEVKNLYWESGVRPTRVRTRQLEDALGVLARRLGAKRIDLPSRRSGNAAENSR